MDPKTTKMLFDNLDKFAKKNNLTFTKNADKIKQALMKTSFNCPCKVDKIPCPCSTCVEDVENNGTCHCGLFEKR